MLGFSENKGFSVNIRVLICSLSYVILSVGSLLLMLKFVTLGLNTWEQLPICNLIISYTTPLYMLSGYLVLLWRTRKNIS